MDVRDIALEKLVPSRNLRTEGTDVTELAESIREHGLLQPIRVRPLGGDMYQIIAGHRRLLAHRRLGLKTISAVVVDESDAVAAEQSIVENLQREDLTPVELAHGVKELATAFGLTMEVIARAISKSPGQVRTWVRLSRLPDEILAKLESGEGRTQLVEGPSPRVIQPFISDMPSEEEVARDPEAAVRFGETVSRVAKFQEELEERGARVNAHMADEIARRTKSGQVTLAEAMDEVLAHPERYRYAKPISSASELEEDTWASYRDIHQQMSALVYKLRPEIAALFSLQQSRDLLERLSDLTESLDRYRIALEGPHGDSEPARLTQGGNRSDTE
jgi:ParB/RepB/Spo0J family partition protein